MKAFISILFIFTSIAATAQTDKEETLVFTRWQPERMPDSTWNNATTKQKLDYCLSTPESYTQICSSMNVDEGHDTKKYIYAYNPALKKFGEFLFSKRQRDLLNSMPDSVEYYLKESLLLNKEPLAKWDYLLVNCTLTWRMVQTLQDVYELQGRDSTQPLSLLVSLMKRQWYEPFIKSPIGKTMQNWYSTAPKIDNNEKNVQLILKLADSFQDTLYYRRPAGRPTEVSRPGNQPLYDSIYKKTGSISDAGLLAMDALSLMNYCYYNEEKYIQLCGRMAGAGRDHRKYVYLDFPFGSPHASRNYSERQLRRLDELNVACQPILLKAIGKKGYDPLESMLPLVQATNTWQCIPHLIDMHKMYGFHTSDYMSTLVALLETNKDPAYQHFNKAGAFVPDVMGGYLKSSGIETQLLKMARDMYDRLNKN